ncbi:DUF2188 domain-containing protein [Luteibacter sp. UNCMF366Tsu5.1]|uniref:DUF2188 domain-containing protein n=1 Tax=Luteibacter sp. UNCMF366Tsu5.1 TaxID=1502758 RepID=UPI000908E32D|nr:DUF2188 domain-containing protein [Luteibacter sp. UNCMF366Tsu5.1]SFW34778.1 hypothetical protein SAMN02800691_1228 [Luteibacter sp. UNCMF366Tsu5.1]
MTRIYEISYHPDDGSSWTLRLDGRPVGRFPSRFEALQAAVNRAAADGVGTGIAIEGADGIWRPFGSDAKRPAELPRLSVGRYAAAPVGAMPVPMARGSNGGHGRN